MNHSRVISIGLSVCLTFALIECKPALAKRIETGEIKRDKQIRNLWVISQVLNDSGSTCTLCISESGIKFAQDHLTLIATSPAWQISLLNNEARACYRAAPGVKCSSWLNEIENLKIQNLELANKNKGISHTTAQTNTQSGSLPNNPNQTKSAANNDLQTKNSFPNTSASQTNVANLSVNVYEAKPDASAEPIKKLDFVPIKIKVLTTSQIPVTEKSLQLLAQIYGIDKLSGIPLKISLVKPNGEEVAMLTTSWTMDRANDAALFEIPSSYRVANSQKEVESMPPISLRSLVKKDLGRKSRN
jgi:hypothetical protein